MIIGTMVYIALEHLLTDKTTIYTIIRKADLLFIIITGIIVLRSALLAILDSYINSNRQRTIPLKGFIQGFMIIIYFIGAIIIVAVLLDKSPSALLTGLGASAAILMLIFKDSILGFVAGVQLSQNNMIRIGDWIQLPSGSANGVVEEITLNTVKVRNWDNTLSMVPPYTLVSAPFKNWRGMMESGGRRVDKMIYLDITTVKSLTKEMTDDICSRIPLMSDYHEKDPYPTNSQLYRAYITRFVRQHPVVAKDLDIIIAQRETGECGLPIEVYFFLTQKEWAEFERIQSDIFDHLIAMASDFDLKLYIMPQ
jgi:small-conductance mechanosensitive channel